jgi:hypothetical protein
LGVTLLRREFAGGVLKTQLAANISNTANSISVIDGSTFPSGAINPFVIVIGRGSEQEEKILCSSRAANTFTVAERGYDSTPAIAHASTASVDHILDATTIQDMNTVTNDTSILSWMGF